MLSLDETDRYHELACLRSWLFWVELRRAESGTEESAVTGLFYALFLAIVLMFPPRYVASLSQVCRNRIKATVKVLEAEREWVDHASFLEGVLDEWSVSKWKSEGY